MKKSQASLLTPEKVKIKKHSTSSRAHSSPLAGFDVEISTSAYNASKEMRSKTELYKHMHAVPPIYVTTTRAPDYINPDGTYTYVQSLSKPITVVEKGMVVKKINEIAVT